MTRREAAVIGPVIELPRLEFLPITTDEMVCCAARCGSSGRRRV
jgi:hypothetical protein